MMRIRLPAGPGWLRTLQGKRLALVLPLLAVPALWPLWLYGPPGTPDALVHYVRVGLLDDTVRQGILYPRWLPAAMLGHGYPSLNYYAPGSYYVAEILRLLGLSHYYAFTGAYALFVLLAGLGMYLLARDVFGPERPWPALAASVAYMYAPYLLTNIYVRGAYAETAAQVLVPWIFWSARRLMRAPRAAPYVLPAALSLGALAVTHNVTLIFVPVPLLIYMAIHWRLDGSRWSRVAWAGAALALAVGISAFFWLPLLFEQRFIHDLLPEIAASTTLGDQAWRWRNFLDLNLVFDYSEVEPYQLGLAQALVAVAGFVLARRRDAEWIFFGLLALAAGLMMGAWTLPLWYGNRLLLVAQFTWRLLSIMSLPLALLAGGILLPLRRARWAALAGTGLIALIIVANHPEMKDWGPLAPAGHEMTLASEAHAELLEPNLRGASGLQEFTPRWVQDPLNLRNRNETGAPQWEVSVQAGNAYGLEARITGSQGGPLRFGGYYFPGWQALLDGHTSLATYPSTNLGLLTMDLPPGEHTLRLMWTGTTIQRAGTLLSLLALAGLAALAWFTAPRARERWLAVPALCLLLTGAGATFVPARLQPVLAAAEPASAGGVHLAGYRTARGPGNVLYIYPYWNVTEPTPGPFRVHWRLEDAAGQTVSQVFSWPYFGTTRADNWPAGSLQGDAYALPLPANLPAGQYRLTVQLGSSDAELARPPIAAGTLALAGGAAPAGARPAHPLDVAAGKDARLTGYDITGLGPGSAGQPPQVQPGQVLRYTFYWQADRPIAEDRRTAMDLVDRFGKRLTEVVQWPGPWFSPSMLWNAAWPQADTFLLRVPADAPAGLYWPELALQNDKGQNQPMRDATGTELGERFRLPPIKIAGGPVGRPEQPLDVRMDQFAQLTGYDLALPPGGAHPGTAVTLTLYYRSTAAADQDYVRFVHLVSPSGSPVAQHDGPTQSGLNTISDWRPGETIRDEVVLTIPTDAQPGRYNLVAGFYPPGDPGHRVSLHRRDGQAVPDAQVVVAEVVVQ
jgi:hypothetical protein